MIVQCPNFHSVAYLFTSSWATGYYAATAPPAGTVAWFFLDLNSAVSMCSWQVTYVLWTQTRVITCVLYPWLTTLCSKKARKQERKKDTTSLWQTKYLFYKAGITFQYVFWLHNKLCHIDKAQTIVKTGSHKAFTQMWTWRVTPASSCIEILCKETGTISHCFSTTYLQDLK